MKRFFVGVLASVFSLGVAAIDIYKCSDDRYTNTSPTVSPEMLVARGCKRLALRTDPITTTDAQQIVIPKSADGHFRMNGQINGKPLVFMVDTGATLVSVSEEFARSANLVGGRPVVMRTASGDLVVRVIDDVSVSAGDFTVPFVKVSVGLSGLGPNEALLGQSFLSQFQLTMDDRQLILRNKKK
jgi:clan AA aspartic protease, TIGR02281 family